MRMFLASVVNRGSTALNCSLLSLGIDIPVAAVEVLIPQGLILLRGVRVVWQISVAQMKSAAFLRASASIFSFCSAKENLKRPLLRPFKKQVYATPSSKSGISTAS